MSDPLSGLPQAPPPWEGYQDAPPERFTAPPPVVNAVRLMLVSVVLGVLSTIILFATKDDFKKAIRKNTPTASDATINTSIAVAVVLSLVLLVLYLLLAFQVRRGRNWARIVTWVFAGIGVLGGLSSLAQANTGVNKAFTAIGLVVNIGIVILLALTPSNQYFKRRY